MTGKRLAAQVAAIPSVRSHTATFVRMESGLAVINTGDTQIRVPCVGYYPPRVNMAVQVEWRAGKPAVIGPAVTKNPIGEITGTGSPRAEVTVDGVAYLLPYEDWYTPNVSDVVSVDWQREVIVGKLSTSPVPEPEPPPPPPSVSRFDVTILASASGKYDYSFSNWWGGSEVWASNSNDGIWVYGNAVRDGVGASAVIEKVEILLPLTTEAGSCAIGVHDHFSIPGGAPNIQFEIGLGVRRGWVQIPNDFGNYLLVGGRGIGVTAPTGGLNKWNGAPSPDSWSGALRFQGTR